MKRKLFLGFLIISSQSFAFDFDLEKLGASKKNEIGQFSIIEYPEAPVDTFEFLSHGKSLFARSGNYIVINHPRANLPLVTLHDSDNNGEYDRIDYEIYDPKGQWLGSSLDFNFDGQTDLRINVSYIDGKPKGSSFVWISDSWHKLHEKGRDSEGLIKRYILMNNKWVRIIIGEYPFKLGE